MVEEIPRNEKDRINQEMEQYLKMKLVEWKNYLFIKLSDLLKKII